MELANQDNIRMLRVKETYKDLSILETDTIRQVEMKKIRTIISEKLENYSRQSDQAETLSME